MLQQVEPEAIALNQLQERIDEILHILQNNQAVTNTSVIEQNTSSVVPIVTTSSSSDSVLSSSATLLGTLQKQVTRLEKEHEDLNRKYDQQVTDSKTLNKEKNRLKASFVELKSSTSASLAADLSAMQSTHTLGMQRYLQQHQEQLSGLAEEHSRLVQQLRDAAGEHTILHRECEEHRQHCQTIERERVNDRVVAEQIRIQLIEANEELTKSRMQCQTLDINQQQMATQLKSQSMALDQMLTDNRFLETDRHQFKRYVEESESKCVALRTSLNETEAERDKFRLALCETESTVSTLRTSLDHVNAECCKLQNIVDENVKVRVELCQERDSLKLAAGENVSKMTEMRNSLELSRAERDNFKSTNEQHIITIGELRDSLHKVELDLEHLPILTELCTQLTIKLKSQSHENEEYQLNQTQFQHKYDLLKEKHLKLQTELQKPRRPTPEDEATQPQDSDMSRTTTYTCPITVSTNQSQRDSDELILVRQQFADLTTINEQCQRDLVNAKMALATSAGRALIEEQSVVHQLGAAKNELELIKKNYNEREALWKSTEHFAVAADQARHIAEQQLTLNLSTTTQQYSALQPALAHVVNLRDECLSLVGLKRQMGQYDHCVGTLHTPSSSVVFLSQPPASSPATVPLSSLIALPPPVRAPTRITRLDNRPTASAMKAAMSSTSPIQNERTPVSSAHNTTPVSPFVDVVKDHTESFSAIDPKHATGPLFHVSERNLRVSTPNLDVNGPVETVPASIASTTSLTTPVLVKSIKRRRVGTRGNGDALVDDTTNVTWAGVSLPGVQIIEVNGAANPTSSDSGVSSKVVFNFSGIRDVAQIQKWTNALVELGGVYEPYAPDKKKISHLIVSDMNSRTYNSLAALLFQKWVVPLAWVEACIANRLFADERVHGGRRQFKTLVGKHIYLTSGCIPPGMRNGANLTDPAFACPSLSATTTDSSPLTTTRVNTDSSTVSSTRSRRCHVAEQTDNNPSSKIVADDDVESAKAVISEEELGTKLTDNTLCQIDHLLVYSKADKTAWTRRVKDLANRSGGNDAAFPKPKTPLVQTIADLIDSIVNFKEKEIPEVDLTGEVVKLITPTITTTTPTITPTITAITPTSTTTVNSIAATSNSTHTLRKRKL